ncbi:hypothetical protein HBB16_13330 [Pseudonocardia sp. MCCB 268]|nr:hypothetical protein [Pseudonocardia cytotoxica]
MVELHDIVVDGDMPESESQRQVPGVLVRFGPRVGLQWPQGGSGARPGRPG